ncbi:MAG: TonB-dependent receptor [Deltaproteobacteria bacterium]|nr:TonB-dependent receptor [Deltaproteobacteria bacterium]
MAKNDWTGTKNQFYHRLKMGVLALACMLILFSSNGSAEGKEIAFDIPSQAVRSALQKFSDQTDLSLVYIVEEIGAADSNPLQGQFLPEQALSIMLQGTGLVFEKASDETIAIKKGPFEKQIKTVSTPDSIAKESNSKPATVADNGTGADKAVSASEKNASAAASTSESHDDYMLEDTVVTATKTGETRLQDTPIAITAMDEEFLKNRKSFSLEEMADYTPNTEIRSTSKAWSTAFIRGVGNDNPIFLNESAVAIYVDGIYMERGLSGNNSFFDVERIEVLRGPQGTLYGRNATGGAINIITKKPSDELEIKIGAEIGSYSKRRIDATISGPIVDDKLRASLTVSDSESDGWIRNLIGRDTQDENYTGVRAAVMLTPIEAVEFVLRGDYYESDTGGWGSKSLGSPDRAALGYEPPPGYHDVKINAPHGVDVNDWGFSGHLSIDLPKNLTLQSITGFRNRDFDTLSDMDDSSVDLGTGLYKQAIESFSQELQLHGRWGKLDALLGVFYYNMKEDFALDFDLSYFFPGLALLSGGQLETDAYAAFAHVGYRITDKLRVLADLRYSYEEKSSSSFSQWSIPFFPDGEGNLADDWDALTPKFGIDYRLTEDVLLYLSVGQGFRSGNLGGEANIGDLPKTLDQEFIWSYEIGAKTDWFDKKLRANFAAFYNDYTDQQVNVRILSLGNLLNAADSTIMGVELELIARPLPPLTVNFAGSYLDATYDEFQTYDQSTGEALAPLKGNQMPNAPKWKFALGAQWVMPVAELGFFTLRGDMNWTDDIFTNEQEDPREIHKGHLLVNALLRFETADGRWALDAYGKNLGDVEHGAKEILSSAPVIWPAAPRIFGLQVVFSY